MSPVVRSTSSVKTAVNRPATAKRSGAMSNAKKVRGAGKIVRTDLPSFSRQMAAMLSAGMPIVSSLETLEEQAANPNFKIVLREVKKSIEGGSSFSESLQHFPEVFDVL